VSSSMRQEWFSAGELAAMALPGLPGGKSSILAIAERENWCRADWCDARWRKRAGRGGGVEFHHSVLPQVAQLKLTFDLTGIEAVSERETAKLGLARAEMWTWFESQPEKKKTEATRRLEALDTVRRLVQSGVAKVFAAQNVASRAEVGVNTLYAWEASVRGVDRADWLPYLAPRHAGRISAVACDDAAWEMLKSDWLRPEKPTFEACHRRLAKVAQAKGWAIPSERTLHRRLMDLPEGVRVLARDGVEALKRMYPAQERDRGVFHALEAVNADGHKWDVFVKWPDGFVGRPLMVGFQDLYSGKILSWRVDRSENKETVRLAFGDMVENYGIPDHCWLDNGRSFASKWLTGGTPNRYRFKVKDDDPAGIMTSLGIEIHWTTPYHGQAKPIERAWRDFAGDVAKHPRFAGAYCGNNPTAKPENYGSTAVPMDVFLATVREEIIEHNARDGRRAATCRGRSFDTTFAESYVQSPIKKATGEQRRLWLLAAEAIGTAKTDGAIALMGNRYWADFLLIHRQSKVTVRFDPQALHQPLHVYRQDGAYLGSAPCIEAVGFADQDAAQTHARARNTHVKATKMLLKAEREMTPAQVAALLPTKEEPAAPPPETRVVRLVTRGATALQPVSEEDDEIDPRQERVVGAIAQMNRVRTGHLRAVVSIDGDD
jgi:putative transposase